MASFVMCAEQRIRREIVENSIANLWPTACLSRTKAFNLYDITCKLEVIYKGDEKEGSYDISNLSPGVYFLKPKGTK